VKVADCKFVKVGASMLILVDGGAQMGGQIGMVGTSNHVGMDGNGEDGLDLGDSDDFDVDDPYGTWSGVLTTCIQASQYDWVSTYINVD
jgi:hypothetical protein